MAHRTKPSGQEATVADFVGRFSGGANMQAQYGEIFNSEANSYHLDTPIDGQAM